MGVDEAKHTCIMRNTGVFGFINPGEYTRSKGNENIQVVRGSAGNGRTAGTPFQTKIYA